MSHYFIINAIDIFRLSIILNTIQRYSHHDRRRGGGGRRQPNEQSGVRCGKPCAFDANDATLLEMPLRVLFVLIEIQHTQRPRRLFISPGEIRSLRSQALWPAKKGALSTLHHQPKFAVYPSHFAFFWLYVAIRVSTSLHNQSRD